MKSELFPQFCCGGADAQKVEIREMAQSSTVLKTEVQSPIRKSGGWVFPLRQADQDAIREAMVGFCHDQAPLAHRLRVMVELAACLSGRDAALGFSAATVEETLICFENAWDLDRFSVVLSKQMTQGGAGLAVLAQMAEMRLLEAEWGVGADFKALWNAGPADRLGDADAMLEDPDTAWRALQSQIEALDAVIPGRMGQFSAQFVANYWTRCFWRSGEMTLEHCQRMLALIGIIRMTIACEPQVREARGQGRKALSDAFDNAARRNTWISIRAFEQHPTFEAVLKSLDPVSGLVETRSLCHI
jgi:hypothetical protein